MPFFVRNVVCSTDNLIEFIIITFIPEEFTVEAHPALFEGEEEGGQPNNKALLFQSTVDTHTLETRKNTQKPAKANTLWVYRFL